MAIEELLSGAPLVLLSLVLGLLVLALLWPQQAKPTQGQPPEPLEASAAAGSAVSEAPRSEAPVGPAGPAGPALVSGHRLWLLRRRAVQSLLGPEGKAPRRRIWEFLDDRPDIVATGCYDGQARIFSLKTGKQLVSLRHDATSRDAVHSVHLQPGPRLLSGAWDGRWHEWEAFPQRPRRPSEFLRGEAGVSHENQVTSLALSRDGDYLACACSAGKVLVYRRNCPTRKIQLHERQDVEELKDSLKLGDHGDFVVQRSLQLAQGTVQLEAQEQLLPEASLEGFSRRAALDEVDLPATFHLRFVGCLTHGHRRAWRSLEHDAAVLCMELVPEGPQELLYSGSRDRQIRKWCLHSGELLATYLGHTSMVRCLSLSSRYLASGSDDRTVRLWDRHSLECIRSIPAHRDFVKGVALCHDFPRLVSCGGDGLVILWDVKSGEQLRQYPQPSVAVAVLLAGSCLVTASEDGRLRIWDTESAALHHTAKHSQGLSSLSWLRVS